MFPVLNKYIADELKNSKYFSEGFQNEIEQQAKEEKAEGGGKKKKKRNKKKKTDNPDGSQNGAEKIEMNKSGESSVSRSNDDANGCGSGSKRFKNETRFHTDSVDQMDFQF